MSPSINLVHLNSLVFTQNSIRILYRITPVGSFDVYKQAKQISQCCFYRAWRSSYYLQFDPTLWNVVCA